MIWHVSCIEGRVGSLLLTTQYPWPNNIWTKKWIIYAESSYHLELLSNGPPLFCHSWTTKLDMLDRLYHRCHTWKCAKALIEKACNNHQVGSWRGPFSLLRKHSHWPVSTTTILLVNQKNEKKIKITSAFNREKKQQKRWFSNLLSVHVAQLINKIQKSWWFNFLVV